MTRNELEDVLARGVPFSLLVADGRTFAVPHRDFVSLPPRSTSVTLALPDAENPENLRYHVIPLLMVSGITHGEPAGRG